MSQVLDFTLNVRDVDVLRTYTPYANYVEKVGDAQK
jgi:hypothetical protein